MTTCYLRFQFAIKDAPRQIRLLQPPIQLVLSTTTPSLSSRNLDIVGIIVGEGGSSGSGEFLFDGLHQLGVDLHFGRLEGGSGDELERVVANDFPREPQERLFEVVVRLGRDFVILEVLFSVECDSSSLNFSLFDVDFVTAQNDRNVFAHAIKIAMPIGYVLVRDPRGHVEHDDAALTLDVITITEPTKLLLAGCVPNVEDDVAEIGREGQRVDFNTESGDVFLLEFPGQMTLDESRLASTTITDEDELESRYGLFSHSKDLIGSCKAVER